MTTPRPEAPPATFPIGDATWQRMVERIDAMPEGNDPIQARIDLINAMLIERNDALAAARQTPDRREGGMSDLLEKTASRAHRVGCRPINGLDAEVFNRDWRVCRNEECREVRAALSATTERPLDVERLAEALWNVRISKRRFATTEGRAEALAAEYARLTDGETP